MAAKVAMPLISPNVTEITELQQALHTAQFELNYERSSRIVEGVCKDEEIRKLRFKIAVMEDEIEDLNEQLAKEEERADVLVQDLEDAVARSNGLDADVQQLMNEVRIKSRELDTAKTELSIMNDVSNDTAKVIKEKLALTRELSNLKPEVEHLRSQVASNQDLLAEKLSLQRQLSTVQVELENAKRTADRAVAKAGKAGNQDSEYESQIEDLQKKLREAKQASKDEAKEMESLKKELAAAKKAAEKLATKQDIDEEGAAKFKSQAEELKKELAMEKKERQRAEKAIEKEQAVWEAQRSAMDEKLTAFRTKLKSTKEKLKEKESDLEKAREAAAVNPSEATKPTKNPRKRPAAQLDPDAAIGTPGDAIPAKRGKRSFTTAPGDKSTFSITPFLNRTMSLAPESPEIEKEEEPEAEAEAEAAVEVEVEPDATPTAAPKKAAKKGKVAPKPKIKPLAPASSAKQNSKPSKRAKAAVPTLEKVTEEEEVVATQKETEPKDASKNKPAKDTEYRETTTTTTVSALVPKLKPSSMKPRKSLMSFATFTEEAPEKKKKKKLLNNNTSGLGKTLFDEDDGDKLPAKPIPGRGLFAGRALGKGAFAAKKALKGPLLTADDGFQFSPLKKDRKAAALAQSMLGD